MSRVRLIAEVEPELRRRVKVAAVNRETSVSEWVEDAVRRELEREAADSVSVSRASVPAFARDWESDEDGAYDERVNGAYDERVN